MLRNFVAWTPNRKNSPGWIVEESGCHIWIGSRNQDGYGNAWYKGRCYKAHRIRYELEVGPIPEGMELDHYGCSRGHEGCCNPLHCRPVTHRENVLRGKSPAADNLAKTHCPEGHVLAGQNLVANLNKRLCRQCRNTRVRALRHRRNPSATHRPGAIRTYQHEVAA